MSYEENSGVFSRRKDYEQRVPIATLPLPTHVAIRRAKKLSPHGLMHLRIGVTAPARHYHPVPHHMRNHAIALRRTQPSSLPMIAVAELTARI